MLRRKLWPILAAAAAGILGLLSVGYADHGQGTSVTLLDSSGAMVTSTTPYSPKASCARLCHVNELSAEMQAKYPSGYSGHNYGSGEQHSTHTQGVIAADGNIYWQSYDVKGYEHGASVGRHSNQGRNESFSNQFRTNFALPFFTSSPGMFGKF